MLQRISLELCLMEMIVGRLETWALLMMLHSSITGRVEAPSDQPKVLRHDCKEYCGFETKGYRLFFPHKNSLSFRGK